MFVLLLALVLASPLLAGRRILPPREEMYSAAPWDLGAFPYLHEQIFAETNDIDIAFMGSSTIWWGIDTPQVQAALSRLAGRPAVVRSLCWNWNGLDAFYYIAQDLLAHRHVHMIVFNDMSPGWSDTAHSQALHWFRYADNAEDLAGLDWRAKASYYASAIQGVPRNLMGRLRPDLGLNVGDEISWSIFTHVENPARRLGSLPQRFSTYAPFADYAPAVRVDPAAVRVYTADSRSGFEFAGAPVPPTQAYFARKIAELARRNQVRLVYLHMPRMEEFGSDVIPEKVCWPAMFQQNLPLLGVPEATLFAGLTREQVQKLFCDHQHFDLNGQEFFTPIIIPRLLGLYEKTIKP